MASAGRGKSDADKVSEADGAIQPAAVTFQSSAKQIRDAAKWLIVAFAAIATVFLAGTQFSSLGSLPWGWRAAAAMTAAAATVVGLVLVIWILLDVLLISEVTLADLVRQEERDEGDELAYIKRNPASLQGFSSVWELSSTYLEALRSVRLKSLAYYDARVRKARLSTIETAEEDAQAASERFSYLQSLVSYLVTLMAYEQLQGRLKGRRRVFLFAGALLVAAGLGVFAWAVNPAKNSKASNASSKSSPAAVAIGLRPRRPCVVSVRVDGKRTRTVKPGEAVVTINDASRLCGVTLAGAGLVVGSALRHTGKTSETVTLKPISYRVTIQQLKKPGSTKTITVPLPDLVVGPPP
jgi:hypothetical protein